MKKETMRAQGKAWRAMTISLVAAAVLLGAGWSLGIFSRPSGAETANAIIVIVPQAPQETYAAPSYGRG